MFRWIPFAMVRVTAFFIAGILAGIYRPDDISEKGVSVVFALLLTGYFLAVLFLRGSSWLKTVSGLTGLTLVFVAGYIHLLNSTDARLPGHISHLKKPIGFCFAEIAGAPEEKINSTRIEIEIKKIKCNQLWESASGKSLLYVSRKSGVAHLGYGDKILIKGSPVEVSPPANPGEFDLRRFLSFRNISHQQFVSPSQIKLVGHVSQRGALVYSQKVREWATAVIRQFISGAQNQAIARALVLGVTEGIDNDLQGAYAASGAMHILSVSGLHVGIIYGIILFLLRPLSHHSSSRWLVAFLSLICLWAYAFITALSPSVLRAVTMFSFIVVARPFARDTNIYNTLAASAFLLLLYDPYLVMSVGFQLSYLAVVGIVYLQRPLYLLWEPASLVWDKVWQATCVSLAAQLATFSLGLFYFHQFPVYFLFSNLVVIPLSVIVLVMGVLLLAVSPIPWLAGVVGFLLQFTISFLNRIVFFVEGLPFSVINGVQITALQCALLLGLIVVVIRLFESRSFQYVVGAFALLMIFTCIQWRNLLANKDRAQLIVYSVPGHGALEWIEGSQSYFYSDSLLTGDKDQLRFHIRPHRLLSGVDDDGAPPAPDTHFIKSFSGFRFFLLGRTTVLWIDQGQNNLPHNVVTDYVIIGNDAVSSLERLHDKVRFRMLILESSNSRRYAARMVEDAESENIPVHSVGIKGAFVVNL